MSDSSRAEKRVALFEFLGFAVACLVFAGVFIGRLIEGGGALVTIAVGLAAAACLFVSISRYLRYRSS